MNIIEGKKIAEQLMLGLKQEIIREQLRPGLAVVLVGKNPASEVYVNIKEKRAKEVGVAFNKIIMPEQSSEKEIIDVVNDLNDNQDIHGIVIQLPLPQSNSPDKIIGEIAPAKDVDGLRRQNPFSPPFILSIWRCLQETKENLKGKEIIALVNSEFFGKRLKDFFIGHSLNLKYLVRPQDLGPLPEADVLITALGWPMFIKGDLIKQGVILIDGGISRQEGRVVGDIDQLEVRAKAAWLSPVPGGVGPITVAYLLKNVCLSAQKS